ncbi:hypothetical protein GCM10007094_41070 [Pseudovibrio japonicus]|uniref:Toprim domain-containing protein n=1 Tax=Pseudovibrio japonicus TaxID=366534 RepID=A0ABQ3EVR5_9HYPH|nr:toprim domain-containing protein [Pseudovibrio japonicus]GHB47566.1 hypothetical protein GCM10007094_41070 [Pseudovibrio japonicus]
MSEAQDIVRALGGDFKGSSGQAPCPCCQRERRKDQRGLSVKDASGKTLLTCHKSSCSASDVFAALRGGGIVKNQRETVNCTPFDIEKERQERNRQKVKTQALCDHIFSEAVPISGTPVETYLKTRGIIVQGHKMRDTLRFHPALRHSPSSQELPAMVARVRGPNGLPIGLHRTFLKPYGLGKASVSPARMMLGSCAGGAVRLGPNRPMIMLAEGIETALSLGIVSHMTVWATLSTSGLKGLRLPKIPTAEIVILAADNDPAGVSAAEEAAVRFEAERRTVTIIAPKAIGADWNDVLQEAPQ